MNAKDKYKKILREHRKDMKKQRERLIKQVQTQFPEFCQQVDQILKEEFKND